MKKMVIVCLMVSLLLSGGQALAGSCTCIGIKQLVGNWCGGGNSVRGAYMQTFNGLSHQTVESSYLLDMGSFFGYMGGVWSVDVNTGWVCKK